MNVKRNITYKRQDISSDGIVELHALYKDTPLENTGSTFKIQGKANANRFVVSGQVGDAPPIGAGELDSGHLGLYVSGTDLSLNTSLPKTSIYKIKNNDIAIAEGGMKLADTGENASTKRDTPGQMNIYTTYVDTATPYLTENFSGADKTLGSNYIREAGGGTNLVRMHPYLDPQDPKVAEALFVGGTQSILGYFDDDLSTSEVLLHFFSTGTMDGIVESRASAANFKLFIKPQKDNKPDGLWKNMIDKREGAQKFTIYPPFWRWDHIKPLVKYASEISTPTPASEDAESEPTANNTIFKFLRMTPNNATGWEGGGDNPDPWAISDLKLSTEQSESNGQSLKMYNMWTYSTEAGNEDSSSLYGLKGGTNPQFVCASADVIPYPLYLDLAMTSEQTSMGNASNTGSAISSIVKPEINMSFSIAQLGSCPEWGFSMGQLTTDVANQCMDFTNYCSGSIGTVTARATGTAASHASEAGASTSGNDAIRSNSYKTLMRNFTVTLSNYNPEEGENLNEFLNRGMSAFYSGSSPGDNNIVGGFTVMRKVGSSTASSAAASNKVTAYPIYTRPSHFIASGAGTGGGASSGWNQYIWRGLPLYATSGASAKTAAPAVDYPSANLFLNGAARLNQNNFTSGKPNEWHEPCVDLSMDEFINAKIVFDLNARNSIDESNTGQFFKGQPTAPRTSEAGMCKVYFTKGYSSHDMDESTPAASKDYNITADNPPSIPIYFPCLSGSSKGWDWVSAPERWPNVLTVWLTNYRYYGDNETTYASGAICDGNTGGSGAGLTTGTNDAGVNFNVYGLRADYPVVDTATTDGSGKHTEAYIDKIELRNFGYEIFNNSSQKGMFTLPMGLKTNTVDSPINQRSSGNQMAYCNQTGDDLYIRESPSYVTFGFDYPATIPNSYTTGGATNRYAWTMWNGFSQINFEPDLKYDLYTLQGFKSMVSGQVDTPGTNGKFVNRMGGQTLQVGNQILNSGGAAIASGYKTPATLQAITIDLGTPTGNGSETNKLYFTTGSNTLLSCDGLSQKGTAYMCLNTGNASGNTGGWAKRENIFVSSRIQDIPSFTDVAASTQADIPKNSVVVDNPGIFEVARNATDGPFYVIWIQGAECDTDAKVTQSSRVIGARSQHMTVKKIDGNIITFNQEIDNAKGKLVSLQNLPRLMVGPVKYWITMQIFGGPRGTDEAGSAGNPYIVGTKGGNRTYDNVALLGLSTAPTESMTGSTWNESVYHYNTSLETTGGRSGTYGKPWTLDVGIDSNLELQTDFGYGAFDEENNTGGELYKTVPYVDTISYMDVKVMAESMSAGDDFKLVLGLDNPQGQQNVEFVNADYSSTDSDILKPHMLWGYHNPAPIVTGFRVSPLFNVLESGTNLYALTNEDLRSVKFTWNEDTEDTWYRMLMIDVSGNTIRNKYHNAKFVIKGNEAPTSPTSKPVTYVYDYTTTPVSKTALTAGGTGDSVGADVRSVITGRQGYAIQTNASSTAADGLISIGSGTNICLDELDEFTIVLHITPVAADATRSAYLFTYGDDDPGTSDAVYCYIHTDGSIRFVVDGNVLQSVSKVAYDGETPMSIILTYNESAPDGKFSKLYIDGVLEDTKETPITGPAINGNTVIGGQNLTDAATATNYQGLIEEIIVYNRSYEIPETAGEYVFKAANVHGAHGNAGDKIIGTDEYLTHSAKLFVYDYTNIRGTTTKEVGSSKQVGWKVTSV